MTVLAFIICCLLVLSAMGDIWLHWYYEHTAVEWACLYLDTATKLAGAALIITLL